MSISESELPGIGRRYEIIASKGQTLVLIIHRSGRRDLYVIPRGEDEPRCAVELTDDQARRIGAILGGAYYKPDVVEEIESIIGDFVVDWVTISEDSPVVGHSIGNLQIRGKTGMSVIAIIRGRESMNAPDPSVVLQASDRLVVVGPRKNFGTFVRFVVG
jgi:TrkA domain protein